MYVEKFRKLMDSISKKEKDPEKLKDNLEFIYDRSSKFVNYFNKVCDHVLISESEHKKFFSGLISREKMMFAIEDADDSRRKAHDVATSACAQINRLCKQYDVPAICPDTTDRHEIAEFIGRFVQDVYQEGIRDKSLEKDLDCKTGHSLDDAFEYAKKECEKLKATAPAVKEKMEEKWKTTESKSSR